MTENYPAPLGYDRAVELATEVVAEVGEDYIYPFDRDGEGRTDEVCVYVDQNKPACFVAKILHRHGVPIEVLREWEGHNAGYMSRTTMPSGRPAPTAPLVADLQTANFLDSLQSFQDGGVTWKRALTDTLAGIKPFPSTAMVLQA